MVKLQIPQFSSRATRYLLKHCKKREGGKNGQNTGIPSLQYWLISVASVRAIQSHQPAKDTTQDL